MLGFQKPRRDVAALISVGMVIAIEYQKFHLDTWHEYYHQRIEYTYPIAMPVLLSNHTVACLTNPPPTGLNADISAELYASKI